ncbi:DUF6896 domain-containing protein [Chryseobacterium gambrini]|uniref:DUF6896 domain-containing protein n=1 Tax=Chryseobacterium gambrini TaxID=373672 RepID=UPI003D10BC98
MTDEEIRFHQKFFENCAKDYRNLAKELILQLTEIKKIKLDEDFPFLTFNQMKESRKLSRGKISDWNFFIHGYHCHFINTTTKQEIEVPFMFGIDFGDLDPYFFLLFIETNPAYQPLPFNIQDKLKDGERVVKIMLELGVFEKMNSNIKNHSGIVVKDRDQVEIKIFNEEKQLSKQDTKFNILKLFRFKRF